MTKKRRVWSQPGFRLFLLTVPLLLLVCVFSYLPLTGWAYAFFDYSAGMKLRNCDFVGWKHFTAIFDNPLKQQAIVRVMKNTLGMSFLGILKSLGCISKPFLGCWYMPWCSRCCPRTVS